MTRNGLIGVAAATGAVGALAFPRLESDGQRLGAALVLGGTALVVHYKLGGGLGILYGLGGALAVGMVMVAVGAPKEPNAIVAAASSAAVAYLASLAK